MSEKYFQINKKNVLSKFKDFADKHAERADEYNPKNAKPIEDVTEFITCAYNNHEIIIWAQRPNDLAVKIATEQWLKLHDIKYHRLLLDKPDNPVYVDETPSHAKFYKHHGDLGIVAELYEEWKNDKIKREESEH